MKLPCIGRAIRNLRFWTRRTTVLEDEWKRPTHSIPSIQSLCWPPSRNDTRSLRETVPFLLTKQISNFKFDSNLIPQNSVCTLSRGHIRCCSCLNKNVKKCTNHLNVMTLPSNTNKSNRVIFVTQSSRLFNRVE